MNSAAKTKYLNIYHGNCADGFGSAWVVREAWLKSRLGFFRRGMEIDFYAGTYQKPPPPEIENAHVIITDFSYKRPIMEEIYERCATLTWIDHHQSAIEDMVDFGNRKDRFFRLTSNEHSGAMLAWNYYFTKEEPPQLLKHIEDRDLWKFLLPGTREIQAALFSYPYDFEIWDKLMDPVMIPQLRNDGTAIERKHFKDIRELLAINTRWMKIGGVMVPTSNLPYTMASDGGHILCEMEQGAPFAATYYDKENGRVFSLRSLKAGGANCFSIAKTYGGGGHFNAAGFEVPRDHPLAIA